MYDGSFFLANRAHIINGKLDAVKALHLVKTLLRTARFFDPAVCISWLIIDGMPLEYCVALALKSLFVTAVDFTTPSKKSARLWICRLTVS